MRDTRVDGTKICLTCGSQAKTSELIRSLRDDEQVKSQEPESANGCVLESEWSLKTSLMLRFLSSISRTRRSFLKADVPVVARLTVPFVVPIDEM